MLIAIVVLHYTRILLPLERLWETAIGGLGGGVTETTGSIFFWHGWQQKAELESEIEELRHRLQSNESAFARLRSLEKENEELKNAIRWRDVQDANYLIGKNIGKPLNLPSSFILINRGETDGVQIGNAVIINEDILIGKVISVNEDTAIVRLITDNKSVFSARLSDGTDPIGRIVGQLGISLLLDTVPATEALELEDIIVTSGIDPGIPDGLVIGTLKSIDHQPNEFFQSASVAISYEQKDISIVSIILSR